MKKLILTALMLCSWQSANAQNWSVGLMAGQAKADDFQDVCTEVRLEINIQLILLGLPSGVTCSMDDSDTALGINVGYQFNTYWGVELGYADLGAYDFTLGYAGESDVVTFELSAPYIAAVGTLPITDKFSVSARVGVFEGSIDATAPGVGSESIDMDSETYLGASLNYSFSDSVTVQLRHDNFEDVSLTGLGLKFNF